MLGTVGQLLGIGGLVVCLLLAVGVVMGRGWAVGTVDDVAGRIDAQIAKTGPILDQAQTRVGEISGRVSSVSEIAAAIAADPNPLPNAFDGLRSALTSVSDGYQNLRTRYADLRETAVSIGDVLATLDRLLPGVSIPQGPADALSALDARLQELDAKVMALIAIEPGQGPVNKAAAAVSQAANDVSARVQGASDGLGEVQQEIAKLRADIASAADTLRLWITLGAIGVILLLLYLALLNWVLFRHAGEIRRKTSAG